MNDIDIESMRTLNAKLFAETVKLQAEGEKLHRERRLYPYFVGAAVLAASTGFVGVIFKLFQWVA